MKRTEIARFGVVAAVVLLIGHGTRLAAQDSGVPASSAYGGVVETGADLANRSMLRANRLGLHWMPRPNEAGGQ